MKTQLNLLQRRVLPTLFALIAISIARPAGAQDSATLERESTSQSLDVPEGFAPLFNGEDLTGWQGLVGNPKTRAAMTDEELAAAQEKADEQMRAHWRAEDGAIVYDASPEGNNICTVKSYGDFELLVDWKIEPAGDSGIYLRGSPQVQIWDPTDETSFDHGADKGSGALWNNQRGARFPLVVADRPIGEWNTFRIRMVGERLTVHLNGQLVTDDVVMENYWERDKPIYATGPIELQKHDGVLWFRNIFIRELEPAGP
jgi:hypothetical protein